MNYKYIIFSFVLATGLAAAETHPHWSYEGDKSSPAHWGELSEAFAMCGKGKNQSPVDLTDAVHVSGNSIDFRYQPARFRIENNGHTVQLTPDAGGETLDIGGKKMQLKQFHFHTPSEHTFNHRHFPMEAHFVHQSSTGELAVLTVLFQEGRNNPALAQILAKHLKAGQSAQTAAPLDINTLFPANRRHFRLNGSLTTPPCSEGVNWIVLETPVSAGAGQIKAMAKMIGHPNNRPVQPLNARIVIEED
ncbi:carbonic anhydrase [Neisseria dentiae]|uniref:carbonic anhydrase n=1 Tax=Neisseria dentiae TaxID=194197 RepID=UPI00359F4D85